jgi:hypothetical protein
MFTLQLSLYFVLLDPERPLDSPVLSKIVLHRVLDVDHGAHSNHRGTASVPGRGDSRTDIYTVIGQNRNRRVEGTTREVAIFVFL